MKKKHQLVSPGTHFMVLVGFLCLALMFLFYGDADQQDKVPIHYYLVSGLGAIGFTWMMVALCIDVWKRFNWPIRTVIFISFLLLSVLSLSIYYLYLIVLERASMSDGTASAGSPN